MKLLSKAEMVEFYSEYIRPSSKRRARISVFLYARGGVDADPEMKGEVVEGVKEKAEGGEGGRDSTKVPAQEAGTGTSTQGQEITDVRRFKAGLMVSAGASAVKEVAEFEERGSKL